MDSFYTKLLGSIIEALKAHLPNNPEGVVTLEKFNIDRGKNTYSGDEKCNYLNITLHFKWPLNK